jgi:2-keto-3-deoxy-6-phosphogluconate aldolase
LRDLSHASVEQRSAFALIAFSVGTAILAAYEIGNAVAFGQQVAHHFPAKALRFAAGAVNVPRGPVRWQSGPAPFAWWIAGLAGVCLALSAFMVGRRRRALVVLMTAGMILLTALLLTAGTQYMQATDCVSTSLDPCPVGGVTTTFNSAVVAMIALSAGITADAFAAALVWPFGEKTTRYRAKVYVD